MRKSQWFDPKGVIKHAQDAEKLTEEGDYIIEMKNSFKITSKTENTRQIIATGRHTLCMNSNNITGVAKIPNKW